MRLPVPAVLLALGLGGAAFAQTPFISALSPSAVQAGSASFNLLVTGAGFVPGSAVRWNSNVLSTAYLSTTQLSAVVTSNLLGTAGTVAVTVVNPNGLASPAVSLTVQGSTVSIVTATLPSATAGAAYSVTLAASGGTPPYTWFTADALPAGVSLSSAGVLAGTPSGVGTFNFTVRVTDASQATATRVLALTVTSTPLTITNTSKLPDAVAGTPYSQTLRVTGGSPPYRWSATGAVPAGLTLDATGGTLSGTPQSRGTYTFTAQVTDGGGASASKGLTLTVNTAPLAIATAAPLFEGTVGAFYSQVFLASGGVQPYTWAVTSGQVPAGLTFDANAGALSGTPSQTGVFNFTLRVTDASAATSVRSFSITVSLPKLAITTASPLAPGTGAAAYTQQFTAIGGSAPYTWSITAGSVPGLTINAATGLLAGTPTAAGTFQFTVQVRDSAGTTASRNFSLLVNPQPLALTAGAELPAGAIGTPYSFALSATGGAPPYSWSANGLPKGLVINGATGEISGTPEAAGALVFTARVTDSARSSDTALYRLSISLPAPPGVTLGGLPDITPPADQQPVRLTLGAPYALPIDGQLTLTFASDVGAGDSTVQFSTGGRAVAFTIPAGAVNAVFPADLGIQTGTVAGTITVTASLRAGGVDITPSPAPAAATRIERAAPVIASAQLIRGSGGFSIRITGYTTSREVTRAVFRFKASPGSTLQQSEITVSLESLFAAWFQDAASSRYGSQFTFTQPFTAQGDASAVTPDTVTLGNRLGDTTAPVRQ